MDKLMFEYLGRLYFNTMQVTEALRNLQEEHKKLMEKNNQLTFKLGAESKNEGQTTGSDSQ